MSVRQLYSLCSLLFLTLFLASCEEQLPQGTIALVNGEPVSLRLTQALMDSRSASMATSLHPTLMEMRNNYGQAAAILIVNTLVRQELAKRGMAVGSQELDKAIAAIRDEYEDGQLDAALEEAFLREEDWRQFMRDTLALDIFFQKVLLPSIHVSLDDIKAYYESHKAEFNRPALVRVCYAAADNQDSLQAWCKSGDAESFKDSPFAQCAGAAPQDLPDPWKDEVKKLKPLSCGKILQQDDQWRALALIERQEPQVVPISEAYPLIENILLEQRKNEAFEKWLQGALAASDISAAPDLFPATHEKSDF